MRLKAITQFLKDLGSGLKHFFTSRIVPFVLVVIVLFGILLSRLFSLQIVKGEYYKQNYTMKAQREIATVGPRGNIYDKNGELLAYSELAYSVVIEDCGYYDSTKVRNETLNEIIAKTISIIEENGDNLNFDFPIEYTEFGTYRYNIEGNSLQRFLRDILGKKSVGELTEEEKNITEYDLIKKLKTRYRIDSKYDDKTALDIIYVRYNLSVNSYKRYISFTLARNVSEQTMAAILESSSELTGVGIEEEYLRKYNYSKYIAHIIGYTGKVSESELEELKLSNPDYTANDVVGKSGIESIYETVLAGKKGTTTMLVDTLGRVQEITAQEDAQVGNDIYLTIDVKLQEKIYNLLERRLAETLITNIVEGDETNAGLSGDIVMPVTRVYFAFIDNNMIDMDKIAESDTEAAKNVYSVFSSRKAEILGTILAEMQNGTPYNDLSDDMKEYIKRIRTLLIEKDILSKDKISSEDELSKKWSEGTISLKEYLEGAISSEWININNLDVSTEYPTTDEVIAVINELVMKEITKDSELNKLIYKELILNRTIPGRLMCMILMEQDAVKHTDSEYLAISNGASPYEFVKNKISSLEITPAQLALDPCSGSCVMEDPNTGNIIALVSYPSYDINLFSGTIDSTYYKSLLNDKSTPLVNRATHTRIAPGSTFKPLTAVAALTEGIITSNDTIYCKGIFDSITPNIKCWNYPNEHGPLATEEALQRSCNVYFCELGYRLSFTSDGSLSFDYGLSRLKKYAEMLGLATKTGIQIQEAAPRASDYNPASSAIGQGTNAYTSLNLARYVSTIANRGTVYNSNLIGKITDSDGNVIKEFTPDVANKADSVSDATWTTVQNGMARVISEGAISMLTNRLPVKVCGKSGTAQEDKKRGNHACYVMFSQNDQGQADVVATVMLPYAYAASNAGIMAYYAMASYYDTEIPSSVYFDVNTNFIINE